MSSEIQQGSCVGVFVDDSYQKAVVLGWRDKIVHFFPGYCLPHRLLSVECKDKKGEISTVEVSVQDIIFPFSSKPGKKTGFHLLHFEGVNWNYPEAWDDDLTPKSIIDTYLSLQGILQLHKDTYVLEEPKEEDREKVEKLLDTFPLDLSHLPYPAQVNFKKALDLENDVPSNQDKETYLKCASFFFL